MLDALVAGPGGAVQVKQRAVELLSQGGLAAAQRGALVVNVGVLVQGDVDDVGVLDLGGHLGDDGLGFLGAAQFGQALGLDLHEAAAQLVVSRSRQHGQRVVDDHEADVGLSQVGTRAGGNEHELNLLGQLKGRGIGGVDDVDSLVGVAQPALGIGLNGAQRLVAAHTAHGANLAQRLLISARGIRGQSSGLADNVDAAGAAHGSLRMLVGGLGVEVDQLASHHEVAGDDVAVGTGQRHECARGIAIKLGGAHAGRNRRLIRVGGHILVGRRVVLVVGVLAAVVATRATSVTLKPAAVAAIVARGATSVVSTLVTTASAILETTTAIITTLETTTIIATIIATTEVAALTVATLEVALTITTIITAETTTVIATLIATATIITVLVSAASAVLETATAIVTVLVTVAIFTAVVAIAPLRLTL